MDKKETKQLIILVVIILCFIGLYFLLSFLTKKNKVEYSEYLKNYEVNEYIPTYVSDEAMAKIYLNDYIHTMYYDIEEAYNLLDSEYKEKKFKNIEDYKKYVNNLKYSTYDVASYFKVDSGGYTIFGVYDRNDNFYAFKTKGVMQYSVFLDEDTVEIW